MTYTSNGREIGSQIELYNDVSTIELSLLLEGYDKNIAHSIALNHKSMIGYDDDYTVYLLILYNGVE